jgi:hypothetical protein
LKKKTAILRKKFWRKYFQNHNIGPCFECLQALFRSKHELLNGKNNENIFSDRTFNRNLVRLFSDNPSTVWRLRFFCSAAGRRSTNDSSPATNLNAAGV